LYENAFSAAPWTPPSHASIFTGKYPSRHKTLGKEIRLKSENTTIAESLAIKYDTLGVTCCQILGLGSGFEKGFTHYAEVVESSLVRLIKRRRISELKDFIWRMVRGPDKGTSQATEMIKAFTKQSHRDRPFFVFVNYFTAHTPYDPPSPFKGRFCNEFDESSLYLQELLANSLLGLTTEKISKRTTDMRKLQWIASGGGGFSFSVKEASVSREEWEIIRAWYDGEIAYLDSHIGNLVQSLKENGILDDTLLLLTSDHGENFGDHGLAVHPLCLYDSLLRVPLIMKYPDIAPTNQKIQGLVSLVDLYPTMTQAAQVKDTQVIDGKSLFQSDKDGTHDFVCAEYGALHTEAFGGLNAWSLPESTRNKLTKIDRGCKAIRTSTFKYILWRDREELYNIRDDPDELLDISKEHPQVTKELKKKLANTVDLSYAGAREFPKEQKKQIIDRLKALGYV